MFLNLYSWIFLGFGVFWFLYIFWNKGLANGFDKEKLLDVSFILLFTDIALFFGLTRLLNHLNTFYYNSLILKIDGSLFILFVAYVTNIIELLYFCKRHNWSKYRLIDIYAEALVFFAFFANLSFYFNSKTNSYLYFLMYLVAMYMASLLLVKLKLSYSGMLFALINVFLVPPLVILRLKGYLLIAVILLTITLSIVLFRRKKL